jgi:crotonobetainyl-CoA:carnitine CoA-transferase CaiB-like acyl-CoA transferase
MLRQENSLLAPYRALDLSTERGQLCGKLLGDLGADVIKLERPGGDPARSNGPFYHDIPHPERSLFWWAFNNNKRGITLDIETADGQSILKRMVKSADFVIESFDPGYMEKMGLGYSVLRQANPGIIMVAITPFGQEGPHTSYKGSDLIVQSMGGQVFLTGDPDRPPVRISFPISYTIAGAEAANALLLALCHRNTSGQGQFIDLSMQQCIFWQIGETAEWWHTDRQIVYRYGAKRIRPQTGGVYRMIWPCKGGFVAFYIMGGHVGARDMRGIVAWMEEDGLDVGTLRYMDWDAFDMAKATQEMFDWISEPIGKFFLKHTRRELIEGAVERRLRLYPVSTSKDILEIPQLKARGFWVDVEHSELGATVTYPGPWANASESPVRISRRAPFIGEHNGHIYIEELGLSLQDLSTLKEAGVI